MIAFLRRLRAKWRRSVEKRDQEWAEEALDSRTAAPPEDDDLFPPFRTSKD